VAPSCLVDRWAANASDKYAACVFRGPKYPWIGGSISLRKVYNSLLSHAFLRESVYHSLCSHSGAEALPLQQKMLRGDTCCCCWGIGRHSSTASYYTAVFIIQGCRYAKHDAGLRSAEARKLIRAAVASMFAAPWFETPVGLNHNRCDRTFEALACID